MRPTMPTEQLIDQVCDDGADYSDGDDPGYYRGHFDAETGDLVLVYEPDEDPDLDAAYQPKHGPTTVRFREIPAGGE